MATARGGTQRAGTRSRRRSGQAAGRMRSVRFGLTEEVYRHQLKPVITRGCRDHEHHLHPAEPSQVRVRQWLPGLAPEDLIKIRRGTPERCSRIPLTC